jgi:hypothetical protein
MNITKDYGFFHQFFPGYSIGRNFIKCTLLEPSIVRTSTRVLRGHMLGLRNSDLCILAVDKKTDSMRNPASQSPFHLSPFPTNENKTKLCLFIRGDSRLI